MFTEGFETIETQGLSPNIAEVVERVNQTITTANSVNPESETDLNGLINDAGVALGIVKSVWARKGLVNGLPKENADALIDCETALQSISETAESYIAYIHELTNPQREDFASFDDWEQALVKAEEFKKRNHTPTPELV